jgi:predicted dehydrogenase
MTRSPLRIGLIGAGANSRTRHIPGLQALSGVEIVAVCNRRPTSTVAVARAFGIPHTYDRWEDLVADPDIDAIVIGTWPYLHCPITLAALEAGKHVLTEARMARNAVEAHRMLAAAHTHPKLVTQVVPSPYGLTGHQVMVDLLKEGYLGQLREVYVQGLNANLADPAAPLTWRQDAVLSGYNVLTLGIFHETLMRWVPQPVRVLAQAHAFIPTRIDPESGARRPVGTPDSVQVLAVLENGARAVYQVSGVVPFGQSMGVWLYGSEGVLHYDFQADRIRGASRFHGRNFAEGVELQEIPIPPEKAGGWRVEEEFVAAIREGAPVRFTDFATAVGYVEFTEAVARSAQRGEAVALPLELEDSEEGG